MTSEFKSMQKILQVPSEFFDLLTSDFKILAPMCAWKFYVACYMGWCYNEKSDLTSIILKKFGQIETGSSTLWRIINYSSMHHLYFRKIIWLAIIDDIHRNHQKLLVNVAVLHRFLFNEQLRFFQWRHLRLIIVFTVFSTVYHF